MRLHIFFLFSITLISGIAAAQTPKIESYKLKRLTAKNDAERLNALLLLSEEQASINKDSLLSYALAADDLAGKQDDGIKKSLAKVLLINAMLRAGKTDTALAITESELPKNPVSDVSKRKIHFKLVALKADCFGDASKYEEALSELYSLINEAEQYGDSAVLAKNMNTIGVINYNLDHVPQAFSWYFRGLSYAGKTENYLSEKAALCINLAETYRWVEKPDSARFFIEAAIPACERVQNLFFLANALRVKASIFKQEKNFAAAEATMKECIAIREKTDGKLQFSNEMLALSNIYINANEPDKAIALLFDALKGATPETENTSLGIQYYKSLAKSYKMKGDEKNYVTTIEKLLTVTDAFYEANSVKAIAELETKYELQKKESTIIKQKLDITKKNYLLYSSLGLLAFLAVLVWLLFTNYRRRQQQKMDRAVYEEKLLSAVAIKEAEENERKRVAADLHDNLGAYAASIASNLDSLSVRTTAEDKLILQELRNNSQSIVSQLNDTIWVLKKDNLSLTAISDRIKIYVQRVAKNYPDIFIDVTERISSDVVLPASQAFHVYRIIQEAVSNAVKHSAAKNIRVFFESEKSLRITVSDDGKGISPQDRFAASGNGLVNMRYRAKESGWSIDWEANEPKGTNVVLQPTTN